VSFDPKIGKVGPGGAPASIGEATKTGEKAAQAVKSPSPLAMPDLDAARAASKQKDVGAPSQPLVVRGDISQLEKQFAELERALAVKNAGRQKAYETAIALIGSFAARRSKGARRQALSLCDALDHVSDDETTSGALRIALQLDDALQSGSPDELLAALTTAADLSDEASPATRGLVLAQASQALAMLYQHFPSAMPDEGMLERAFALAEEALALAPEHAEPHAALAAMIMTHGDLQALRDAEALVRRALTLEPEHDPSAVMLATIFFARDRFDEALALLGELHARGNNWPLVQLLTARCHRFSGALDEAEAVLTKAVKLAPAMPTLFLEASIVARLRGDTRAAATYRDRAAELLGPDADVDEALQLIS
jgi:tetratricopeptide (TPR) repeat protein